MLWTDQANPDVLVNDNNGMSNKRQDVFGKEAGRFMLDSFESVQDILTCDVPGKGYCQFAAPRIPRNGSQRTRKIFFQ